MTELAITCSPSHTSSRAAGRACSGIWNISLGPHCSECCSQLALFSCSSRPAMKLVHFPQRCLIYPLWVSNSDWEHFSPGLYWFPDKCHPTVCSIAWKSPCIYSSCRLTCWLFCFSGSWCWWCFYHLIFLFCTIALTYIFGGSLCCSG